MHFSILFLATALLVNAAPIPIGTTDSLQVRGDYDPIAALIAAPIPLRRAVSDGQTSGAAPTATGSTPGSDPETEDPSSGGEECDGEEEDPTAGEDPTTAPPSSEDPSEEPTTPSQPDTPPSGSGGGFRQKNGQDAKQQNEAFAELTADSPCKDGEIACVEDGFAQCVGGKWAIQKCSGGLICAALPLVNSPGTSVACTTEEDRDARIATALAG